jgi:hypothetical protein
MRIWKNCNILRCPIFVGAVSATVSVEADDSDQAQQRSDKTMEPGGGPKEHGVYRHDIQLWFLMFGPSWVLI